MDSLKVFISSTWKDLGPEREAIEATLHRLRSARFVGMEYFGARSDSTRDASLSEVDRSDIYVGVFGHRYGSGITEQEYRRARDRNLPCLIYLKNGWQEPVDGTDADAVRLEALRRELLGRHLVGFFDRPHELVAKLTADLHNLLFDRLVVQGISQLRGDYEARIQRFLTEYLGTSEQPIPFGGREDQLEALDRWVRDPRSAPYAVVAGPAGRGKSALLVHWAQRLMQDADLSVIFFPISIRFRTNLAGVAFASIAARLAALHGEVAPGGMDTPPDVWRTLMLSYLRRDVPGDGTFVLIVDGADESGDWTFGSDLFPAAPPQRLRVVVSARYLAGDVDADGWLERLRWTNPRLGTSFDLPPLTPSGLVDVLRNMSVPLEMLSGRADIVAELFRLSQGDPLLVNLYVADLWTKGEAVARLRPDDLATLEPGLDGYFRRWWDDQRVLWGAQSPLREPTVNAVLDTLACALGPLLSAELLELVPPNSVTVWSLDEALRSLERFVIGDGQSQGYAFSHPRLAYYFHSRLSKAGQAHSQEARFVAWGLACLSDLANGTREAATIPTYVLQFLRPHMERAGSEPRSLMAFASTSWIAAWDRLDKGSYTGFLNDLAHVRTIAEREDDRCTRDGAPAAFMADELRCALYSSSIASIATDVPLEALAQLIAKGIWSPAQAIAYGARIGQADRRMRTLLELTSLSDDANRPLALAAAAAEARTLSDDNEGRVTLVDVIRGLATDTRSSARTARVFAAASQVAQQLPTPHDRWMLEALRYATQNNELPHAHAVAALRAIEPTLDPSAASWCRQEAERRIAALTLESKNTTSGSFVLDTFTLLHQSVDRAVNEWAAIDAALQSAVEALAAAAKRQPGEKRRILSLAFDCVANMEDEDVARGMLPLYPLLSQEHARLAVEQIARIPKVYLRVFALSALREVTELDPAPGLTDDLMAFVDNDRDERDIHTLLSVIPGLAMLLPGVELRRLLDVAEREWPPVLFLDCLLLLAQSRRHAWSPTEVIGRALDMIESRVPPSEQTDPLVGLIDWLLPPGAVNSRAPWRPMPEERSLAPRMTRLLQLCTPPRDIVRASALRISQRCLSPLESRHPLLDIDATSLGDDARGDADAASELPASAKERRDALLEAWSRDSDDQVNQVVTALEKLAPRPELDEALALLYTLRASIPGDSLRQIAARVIDVAEASYHTIARLANILRFLASPPFFPPTSEALRGLRALLRLDWEGHDGVLKLYRDEQLPDILREQLIIVGLTTREKRRGEARTLAQLMEAGLLVHPSDELLGLVLREVAEMPPDPLRDAERGRVLSRIARHVSPAFFGGWLKAHAQMSKWTRREALTTLESAREIDRETHWRQMVEALRSYGSPGDRALWLVDFVRCAPRSRHGDLLDLARSLDGEGARFVALSAMAYVIDMPERRAVLIEALTLARRVSNASAVGHELVQLAIDLAPDDPQLLSAATATAVALPDKRFRASAFADLAPLLSADALAAASQALRTIGDGPARARAMVALASGTVEPRQRETAVTEVVNAISSLPPGQTRHAAMLVVSPAVPVKLRWGLLEEAFAGGFGAATGFDRAELLDATRRALPDAPARVLQLALNWLATQAPDAMRTRTTCSVLPYLPIWLVLPAISLLANYCDDQLAAEVAPHVADGVFARVGEREANLSTETKSALVRIRAAKEHRRMWEACPGAQLAGETLNSAEPLIVGETDIDRAATVASIALDRERAMSARAQLAEVAREIGDVSLRVSTTRYLSALAPERSLTSASDAIGGISPAGHRAVITAHLALRFSDEDRRDLLQDALAAARAETDATWRALAGAELGRLAPALLRDALDVIFGCNDEESGAQAVTSLLRHLDDADAAIAVEALSRIRSEERRALALIDVAATLGNASARAAITVAAHLHSAVLRGRTLAALAERLPDDCRDAALALLDQVTTDFAWLEALAAISRRWQDAVDTARATQACEKVTDVGDEEFAADWWRQVAFAWPASHLADLIQAVRTWRDVGLRTDVLCTVVRIRGDVPADAILRAARAIDDDFHRGVLLGQFAAAREPLNAKLSAEAIACAQTSGHRRRYIDALAAMSTIRVVPTVLDALLKQFSERPAFVSSALLATATLLTAAQAKDVLQALGRCRAGLSSVDRADLLLALGPRLNVTDMPYLFEEIETLTERSMTQLIRDLAPFFGDERSTQSALRVAHSIRSEAFRTEALSALMHILSTYHQRRVLSTFARARSEREQVRRIVDVLPDIVPELHPVVGAYARELRDDDCRIALLAALEALSAQANQERDDQKGQEAAADSLLEELLTECTATSPKTALQTGESPHRPRHALRLSQLVARLRRRPTLVDRTDEVLSAFHHLSEIAKADLLGQLPEYLDEEQQVRVLALLDMPLTPALQRAACDALCRLEGIDCRRRGWAALLPLLDRDMYPQLQAMWREALRAGTVQDRAEFLAQLHAHIPLLHHRGGDAALLESVRAISDAGSMWP